MSRLLTFSVNISKSCYNIPIIQDVNCEVDAIQDFYCNLEIVVGELFISITQNHTRIIISDADEPGCGK